MPPLGPTDQRYVVRANAARTRRRERNLAKLPKVKPASPTPTQIRAARAQERAYASQGRQIATEAHRQREAVRRREDRQARLARAQEREYGLQAKAIRRAALVQKVAGPGVAAEHPGRILHKRDVVPLAVEQSYASQAKQLKAASFEQKVQAISGAKTVRYRGRLVPAYLLATDPKVLRAAGFKGAGLGEAIAQLPAHAITDVGEMAVAAPTSMAKLASTAATHPKKVPGMLAAPYVEAYKHPVEALTEHPVSTALMFAPVARVPGLAVGRAARLAGAQTLERPAAELAGTTLKEQRIGSRDVVVRAVQSRHDRRAPTPVMSAKQARTRVDEFFDASRYHHTNVLHAKRRDLGRELTDEERSSAAAGAAQEVQRRFGEEFGSHWRVSPGGAIVKPKGATEGFLHESLADAERIARAVPFDAKVVAAGPGKYAVVPRVAAERLAKHRAVGTSQALGAKVLRASSRSFRGAVLPLSGKWLAGQVAEAGFRSAVKGAGPTSYLRARRVVSALEREEEGAGRALLERTASGGHFAPTSLVRESLSDPTTLAREFADTPLERPAAALTKAGRAPGVRHVRAGWSRYTRFVFDTVNGRIERGAQVAMFGKALREHPVMERGIIGLSDKAIAEAAEGLRGTEAQVQLGRAVDRAYGRYSKFDPATRELLAHWSPFLPWYVNTVNFLFKVMPADHPVVTSLLASADQATEDWRKAQRMSVSGKHAPSFLLGTYPLGHGKHRNVGRYLPFMPGSPTEAAGSLVLPQLSGTVFALSPGVNWKGERIAGGEVGRARESAMTTVESHIPGVALAGRVTGASAALRGQKKKAQETRRRGVATNLRDALNPAAPIVSTPRARKRRTTVLLPLGGSSRRLPLGGSLR